MYFGTDNWTCFWLALYARTKSCRCPRRRQGGEFLCPASAPHSCHNIDGLLHERVPHAWQTYVCARGPRSTKTMFGGRHQKSSFPVSRGMVNVAKMHILSPL